MQSPVSLERRGNPRRAVIVSGLILAGVTALAGTLSGRRQSLSLDTVMSPPNWPISFRPPSGWKQVPSEGDRIKFEDRRDRDNPKLLALHLTPKPPDWSAGRVATEFMEAHLQAHLKQFDPSGDAIRIHVGALRPEEARLGPLPGARINLWDTGDYVHVGVLPSADHPALVLEYHTNAPFSERDTRTYSMVAESIVVRTP